MLPVTAITPEALVQAAPIVRLDEARKLVAMAHRDEPLQGTSAIRRVAADAARAVTMVPALQMIERHASAVDPFVKYLFETNDAYRVETVRIPLERTGRFSVCVSSQVGCAMACSFCATGRLGLARNLAAWEIVEQVRTVRRELTSETLGRVHGVVFQGMGEPMANLDAVLDAIAVFSEPSALGIDSRNITVCTSGLPNGIRRLAQQAPKVRLGWSVGSGRSDVRRSIMPVANAHSDDDVFDAMVEHARTTGLSPMWAVTLLAGINDFDDDAAALAQKVAAFTAATNIVPRLSIIPYNSIGDNDPYRRTDATREAGFRAVLSTHNLASHKRYSGGGDVAAACGQLVAGQASETRLVPLRSKRA
ncbi:MAG TPA: radical SAM protein [Kofleriaceae bacterium]|nr:radical SAM protein [Kofleriaceae bacterium]